MTNKTSCRACGTYLCPTGICIICDENIAWACPSCERLEDVTHAHDYCNVVCKEPVAIIADSRIATPSAD